MIKAVIFDMDGVLFDSFESNLKFFQGLMRDFGYPEPTADQLRLMHHATMWESIRGLTGLTDEKEINKIFERGRDPNNYYRTAPPMFAGAQKVIETLAKSYKLGIATSRIQRFIFMADMKNVEHHFSAVVGFEDTKLHKPNPEPLLLAAEKLGFKPSECVYIGDLATDVQAGHAAGMKVIIYNERPVEGADLYTNTFSEIPNLVARL